MNKQDSNGVRTAQDIERKYDFAKMLGVAKNFEISEKSIVQIQNALNEMLNALVINLKDVLESQGDVSLWFYSGIPTETNAPYTSWSNPADHYGDLYYDTDAGKVYEFYELEEYTSGTYVYGKHGMWGVNSNPDLLRAMAITNSEIDTSTDHERKIFFQTPTTPYSSGDWWIKTDGSLYICQLGRASGSYEEQDFIDSSYYTPTIAESFDDVITVLKGTVTQLSEDCVRFTDLSTGGSTTIAGENIKTGNIESNNYVQNTSGMKISLSQGTIDTKNFKTSETGNITATSGTIGGFTMTSSNFNNAISGIFNYTRADCNAVKMCIQNLITTTENMINLFDFTDDHQLKAMDYARMKSTLQGTADYHKTISGKVTINSNNPKECFQILNSSNKAITNIGLSGIQTELLSSEGIVVANPDDYVTSGITSGVYIDKTGKLTATGTITCDSLVQTSLEENKKNIEKYNEEALNIIKNIDIYKYNLKEEDDNTKKHIGFVIGNKYGYSEEVTSNNNDGVDNYSFTSLLCKALQEQQEEIEELKKEINKLKEVKE